MLQRLCSFPRARTHQKSHRKRRAEPYQGGGTQSKELVDSDLSKFCHGKSCKLMLSHEIVNNI